MKKLLIPLAAALLCVFLILLYPGAPESSPEVPETIPETSLETVPETTAPIVNPELRIHFIDVGHGDSILLEYEDHFLLVDAGKSSNGKKIVSYLKQLGVEHLDLVSTHAHHDHAGGFTAVLSAFDIGTIYALATETEVESYQDFIGKAEELGLALTAPSPGCQIPFGPVDITVMGPVKEYEKTNNNSIVLMVTFGKRKFLLTADMEQEGETDMLDYWGEFADWDCDVLKVGHHGANTSTFSRLLYTTRPEYSILSVNKNNIHHLPNEEPLSRLRDAGVVLFRTDVLGNIIITTDGEELFFLWKNQSAAPENVEPTTPEMRGLYGNIKSKKFHFWDCKSLPPEKHLVMFYNFNTALADGYIPCSYCID